MPRYSIKVAQPKKKASSGPKRESNKIQRGVVIEENDGDFKVKVELIDEDGTKQELILPFTPDSYELKSGIAGIGQTLRITRHRRVKHHLARHVLLCAESPATECRAVIEDQSCLSLHLMIITVTLILVLHNSQTPGSPSGCRQVWGNGL